MVLPTTPRCHALALHLVLATSVLAASCNVVHRTPVRPVAAAAESYPLRKAANAAILATALPRTAVHDLEADGAGSFEGEHPSFFTAWLDHDGEPPRLQLRRQ